MKNLIILLFVFCISLSLRANHIIGGTVEYTVNSVVGDFVDIDVTFHVYRDAASGGAPFDQQFRVGLHGNDSNLGTEFIAIGTEVSTPEQIENIDFSEVVECLPAFSNIQYAEYKVNFSFNMKEAQNFIVAHQRCCRSSILSNILNSVEAGIALSVNITRDGLERIGVVKTFSNVFPVSTIPLEMKMINMSIDDGLEKRYLITNAKTAGGTDGINGGDSNSCIGVNPWPWSCTPSFGIPNYISGFGDYGLGDGVTIDSVSGEYTYKFISQGVYLVALESQSYVNDILLSTTYQQFIQVVSMCDPNSVIEQEEEDKLQKTYPVPAQAMIYIGTPLTDIIIYSARETRLLTISVFNVESGIDVGDFADGVYFLEGYNPAGEKVVKRFVK
ncbi:MAG: hypothetical protein ACI86M_002973 [Saprospiraceae bacterium]